MGASEGMSYDTLRWVYSNYDEAQLTASGWDPTSILNSDGDDSTHLWSEIDPECPAEEISLSALTDEDWRHDYVFGAIFKEKETGTEDHRDEIFYALKKMSVLNLLKVIHLELLSLLR